MCVCASMMALRERDMFWRPSRPPNSGGRYRTFQLGAGRQAGKSILPMNCELSSLFLSVCERVSLGAVSSAALQIRGVVGVCVCSSSHCVVGECRSSTL